MDNARLLLLLRIMTHEEGLLPKALLAVPLPVEVITALKEVQEAIERKDPETTKPTDDCIQIDCLCGGLMYDNSGRFYFSVHLAAHLPYHWDIALSATEIQDIAQGQKSSIELWCCTNPECGYKTYEDDTPCVWCDHKQDRKL